MSPGVLKNIQWCRLDLQLSISQLCLLLISSPSSPSTSWCERLLLNIQREHDVQRLVQMSTLDVIANILSWWLIESIRVFNFSVWFGHFGARRSSSNRNHQMIFRAQMITEKLRQSLKPETDPESELLPRGDKDCWKTERSLFCSLDFPGCDQRQFSRLSLTPNSSFSVLYSQFEVVW